MKLMKTCLSVYLSGGSGGEEKRNQENAISLLMILLNKYNHFA